MIARCPMLFDCCVCAAQPGKAMYTTIREFVENSLDVRHGAPHVLCQPVYDVCITLFGCAAGGRINWSAP